MAQRLNYVELSPGGTGAMRGVEHYLNVGSGLETGLLELVRLRASLLNGCEYCIGLHTHELKKHNETEGRIAEVGSWRESAAYTERERAALAWTEVITNIQGSHASEAEFAAVREHFSEVEVVNLTIAIASINAWNRMAIAFRAEKRRVGGAGVGSDVKKNPSHDDTAVMNGAPGAETDPAPDASEGDGGKVAVED